MKNMQYWKHKITETFHIYLNFDDKICLFNTELEYNIHPLTNNIQ